uniref:Uncharacterized protein n=1 Tax=Dulem virus 42 TaxID=3145760 RepID=A0AAU8B8I8_9CAUD
MKETYKLRYAIPRLNLNTRPSSSQQYLVYIAEYDDTKSPEDQRYSTITKSCTCSPDGTCYVDSNNLLEYVVGSELKPFTEYILKFHNRSVINPTDDYVVFKTGMSMSLEDSPYHGKMLLPEQSYAVTYDPNQCSLSLGSGEVTYFAYYLEDGKKIETTAWNYEIDDNDLWPSLIPFPSNSEKFASEKSGVISQMDGYEIAF